MNFFTSYPFKIRFKLKKNYRSTNRPCLPLDRVGKFLINRKGPFSRIVLEFKISITKKHGPKDTRGRLVYIHDKN